MPRFLARFSSTNCLMFVVPDTETTVLPLRSSNLARFWFFFETKRFEVTKWVTENDTCCWRSVVFVVAPHSMSIVQLASNGIRFDELTGTRVTLRLSTPAAFAMDGMISEHMSAE